MKKIALVISLIMLVSLMLVGCGGGGGGGITGGGSTGGGAVTGGNAVTNKFHVQDQYGTPISGVSFLYTDPTGATKKTNPTNSNGDMSVIHTIIGSYSVTKAEYAGNIYSLPQPYYLPLNQAELAANAVYNCLVTINTLNWTITLTYL